MAVCTYYLDPCRIPGSGSLIRITHPLPPLRIVLLSSTPTDSVYLYLLHKPLAELPQREGIYCC